MKTSQRENILQQLLLLLNSAMEENLLAVPQMDALDSPNKKPGEEGAISQKKDEAQKDCSEKSDDVEYLHGSLGLVPIS